jgi:hypothetical protein
MSGEQQAPGRSLSWAELSCARDLEVLPSRPRHWAECCHHVETLWSPCPRDPGDVADCVDDAREGSDGGSGGPTNPSVGGSGSCSNRPHDCGRSGGAGGPVAPAAVVPRIRRRRTGSPARRPRRWRLLSSRRWRAQVRIRQIAEIAGSTPVRPLSGSAIDPKGMATDNDRTICARAVQVWRARDTPREERAQWTRKVGSRYGI